MFFDVSALFVMAVRVLIGVCAPSYVYDPFVLKYTCYCFFFVCVCFVCALHFRMRLFVSTAKLLMLVFLRVFCCFYALWHGRLCVAWGSVLLVMFMPRLCLIYSSLVIFFVFLLCLCPALSECMPYVATRLKANARAARHMGRQLGRTLLSC